MAQKEIDPTKIYICFDVGAIERADDGQAILAATITRALATAGGGDCVSFGQINKASGSRECDVTVASHVAYDPAVGQYTPVTGRYDHVDCPGHSDYIENMIYGEAQVNGAILNALWRIVVKAFRYLKRLKS